MQTFEVGKRYLVAKYGSIYEIVVIELAGEYVKLKFIGGHGGAYESWECARDYHIKQELPQFKVIPAPSDRDLFIKRNWMSF